MVGNIKRRGAWTGVICTYHWCTDALSIYTWLLYKCLQNNKNIRSCFRVTTVDYVLRLIVYTLYTPYYMYSIYSTSNQLVPLICILHAKEAQTAEASPSYLHNFCLWPYACMLHAAIYLSIYQRSYSSLTSRVLSELFVNTPTILTRSTSTSP